MASKRKVLTLQDRINVIERSDRGESSRAIAEAVGCGRTQVQNILKDRDKLLAQLLAILGQSDIAANLRELSRAAQTGTLIMTP